MLVSTTLFSSFLVSFLIVSRLMRISWRNALIVLVSSATVGLAIFSALTIIPPLSVQTLSSLPPANEVAIAPIILVSEILSGTYFASNILRMDYMKSLKLALATLLVTIAISAPLYLFA